MSYRTMLVVVVALVFGGSAALGVNLYVRHGGPRPDMVPVVVATKPIPRGTNISADQIKLQDWPKDLVPPGALTRVEEGIGRVAFNSLVKDEPVLESKLGAKNAKGGLASLVPEGMRAFTILTPNVSSGVAGFILPGNKVDVLLTTNGDEKAGGGVTTTLLQNVEILAVDTRLEAPNENKVDPKQLQSVTLLVTPDQSAKLDLGENRGTLHLALRNPDDDKAAKVHPATLSSLQYYQEKPLVDQVKEVIEAYGKMKAQRQAAEASRNQVASTAADTPPPPLEIRTLRGNYTGVVQIESAQPQSGQR